MTILPKSAFRSWWLIRPGSLLVSATALAAQPLAQPGPDSLPDGLTLVEADTPEEQHGSAPANPVAPTEDNESRLSLTLGADWVSAYFFRGYRQEDRGFIAQPYAEFGVRVIKPEREGGLGFDVAAGTWNSVHSAETLATGSSVRAWYESDLYINLALSYDIFTLGARYTWYMYPSNNAANTVQEAGVVLAAALPADEWWGFILGTPSVGIYFETDNSNVGQPSAAYLQLSAGPSLDLFEGKATLSLPVALGLSVDDYYVGPGGDDAFGYVSVGPKIDVPFDTDGFGRIKLTAGFNVLFLGDAPEAVNGGEGVDLYGFVGLSIAY